jgi:hypothetical protein
MVRNWYGGFRTDLSAFICRGGSPSESNPSLIGLEGCSVASSYAASKPQL